MGIYLIISECQEIYLFNLCESCQFSLKICTLNLPPKNCFKRPSPAATCTKMPDIVVYKTQQQFISRQFWLRSRDVLLRSIGEAQTLLQLEVLLCSLWYVVHINHQGSWVPCSRQQKRHRNPDWTREADDFWAERRCIGKDGVLLYYWREI